MDLNPDHLTSEIGLAIAAVINKHTRAANIGKPKAERIMATELNWKAKLTMRNGDILNLSEW